MADLKTTTVTGDLSVSGATNLSSGARVQGGDLTLYQPGTSNSPALIFQRGTLSDNYNDWQLQDRSGLLYIDQRGSGSTAWQNMLSVSTSGLLTAAGGFSGNGSSVTSINASNISSGTLNSARLPSGLEYTSRMVTAISNSSTDSEYPSAKAVYDLFASITDADSVAY